VSECAAAPHQGRCVKLSVSMISHAYLHQSEGIFTQGWRPGRTFGESVGGIPKIGLLSLVERGEMAYLRYQTRPEFKLGVMT
jgi:hypothetical protein